ncbi:hypothetical protein [aff. Roholtiella sp. LEGE 12411]|uniref:hypothetical protein n=1 Tax=aff. Roholtiella sp. LEGE 12411 TaxID=1828822 RepID=UPI00187F64E2|nr:hypothetical protein [aff. Roholtiella sp. LEGE 12411]
MKIGHWALGIGRWTLDIGHWASAYSSPCGGADFQQRPLSSSRHKVRGRSFLPLSIKSNFTIDLLQKSH